jgi:hypothetical protein
MADAQEESEIAGKQFLIALTSYVDFRLSEPDLPATGAQAAFVKRFAAFLETRPGAKENRDGVKDLVDKMSKMKETRGGTGVPPETPATPNEGSPQN